MRKCPSCGAAWLRSPRFCGGCGADVAEAGASLRRARSEQAQTHTRLRAVMVVFVGVLVSLLLVAAVDPEHRTTASLLLLLAQVLVGSAALGCLGWSRGRATLGREPTVGGFLLAFPAALLSLLAALAYVGMLNEILPDQGVEAAAPSLLDVLVVALLVPCCEEWLCRGVLWVAVRPITSTASTIAITSALFALLHGLNGTYLLEVPHRLAGGVIFGWLRVRTGSIWPSILAHALHNGGAMLFVE